MRGEKKNRKKRGTGDKEENPERVSAPESCIMINYSFFQMVSDSFSVLDDNRIITSSKLF